jgi:hypothetical protein
VALVTFVISERLIFTDPANYIYPGTPVYPVTKRRRDCNRIKVVLGGAGDGYRETISRSRVKVGETVLEFGRELPVVRGLLITSAPKIP